MFLKFDDRFFVYWIHLKDHEINDGYIGVTNNTSRRFHEHQTTKRKSLLSRMIKEHGANIVYEVICCGSEDFCYEIESFLRPGPRIGWNVAKGGARSLRAALTGIKKSKPVWNKGMKTPKASIDKFKNTWEEKKKQGYISPNRVNSLGNSNRKGMSGPPMPEVTRNAMLKANIGHTRNRDTKVHSFIHSDGRIFNGTQYEIRTKFNLPQGSLSNIVSGRTKSCLGWKLLNQNS